MYKLTYKANCGTQTKYCVSMKEATFYQAILGGKITPVH